MRKVFMFIHQSIRTLLHKTAPQEFTQTFHILQCDRKSRRRDVWLIFHAVDLHDQELQIALNIHQIPSGFRVESPAPMP